MRRNRVVGAMALTLGLLLLASTWGTATGARKIVFKLALPYPDAILTIDGTETKGDGLKRDVVYDLPSGKEVVTLVVKWEPNNYTKITRKLMVTIEKDDILAIDLSKANPKIPDDIVVRYVPTPDDVVAEMCRMTRIGKNDVVYDLGCGDGRMVIMAVKQFGAKKGVGIDLDPVRVKESKENAKKAGVEDRVEFRVGDVLKVKDLADATVVMLYMGEDINLRLRPILQSTLKPGSRIVSHRFTMGDWKPDQMKTVDSSEGDACDVLMWEIKSTSRK